jgi:hypothetical protein
LLGDRWQPVQQRLTLALQLVAIDLPALDLI